MLKPVYALIGQDSFLQMQTLLSLLQQAPPDSQRVDLDGQQAQLADVLDELRSFAMFGGYKLVILREAGEFLTKFREYLEKYLASPANTATLILRLPSLPANQRIYKLIDKLGGIQKCEVPKDLVRWIIDQGKSAHQLTVSVNAARLLADLVGGDLGRLDNELAKLALQAPASRIDIDSITHTVAFQRQQQMWDMTNELASGRPAEALRRWRRLVQLDSSSEYRAVTWLAMWLQNVQKALELKAQGQPTASIAQQLRIWPREFQDAFFRTAATLGQSGVSRALDLLAQIDHQNKTGVGEAATNVERFLLSIVPTTAKP